MSAGATPVITTRRAEPSDAALLSALAASTFSDTFAADNTPTDIETYMSEAFGEAIQRAELEDPDVSVFFAERNNEVVGYVMLREGPAPPVVRGFDVLEIARFYARRQAIGTGVGQALMQRAIHEAAARGKESVWLAVWERNPRAIDFYRRWEFFEAGTQPFTLGGDQQTDLVLVRRIARES
ncbi:MAG: GNAT family N-acetyltransferase [Gemmatimonadaceae bacterium]